MKIKYKRTKHLPWSLGVTSDDKMLKNVECFEGKQVIVTEKMDGENTTMYNDYIHARSLDSRDHVSRSWVKQLHGQIKHEIPEGYRICGENLYAKHSIGYDNLTSYFNVFSIWDENNVCLSWDKTVEWCNLLGLEPVKVLLQCMKFDSSAIRACSYIDTSKIEGYVIRNANEFHYDDFKENVAKWVRKNHVQTDNHWMHQTVIKNNLMEL